MVGYSEPRFDGSRLMNIKAATVRSSDHFLMDWQPIATAPFNRDLELAVLDTHGSPHAIVFPCRKALHGWVEAGTAVPVIVRPTHRRKWDYAISHRFSRGLAP
jgi:hypothetical protein